MERLINWINNNNNNSNSHGNHSLYNHTDSSSFCFIIIIAVFFFFFEHQNWPCVKYYLNTAKQNEKMDNKNVLSNLFCRLQKCAVWPLSDIFNKFNWNKPTMPQCHNATMYYILTIWFWLHVQCTVYNVQIIMQHCTYNKYKWSIHPLKNTYNAIAIIAFHKTIVVLNFFEVIKTDFHANDPTSIMVS